METLGVTLDKIKEILEEKESSIEGVVESNTLNLRNKSWESMKGV
jgi:hypothetical protein